MSICFRSALSLFAVVVLYLLLSAGLESDCIVWLHHASGKRMSS